jgi:glutathione S-transferase
MQKPEIIGSLRSSYTRAVCMACIEKQVPYTFTQCLLGASELLAINPFGKMPVMRHGDFELYESKAIATYLDRAFEGPPLFPSEPRLAALTEQWISVVNSSLYGTVISYLQALIAPQTADGSPDVVAIEALKPQLRMRFSVLDKALASTPYLAGEQLSFADLNLVTILHNVPLLPGTAELLAASTHLTRYHDRRAARDSYRTTLPPPGPPRRAPPTGPEPQHT